jgi:fermentation-respiration switch protein FrsA (DUF1100 family)
LLACVTGEPADIFFPRLAEPTMLTFSSIADALLTELGFEPDRCATDEEARLKAAAREPGDRRWPVYYFESDTSGEKSFEEFYTDTEVVDESRFEALGVVKATTQLDVAGIRSLVADLAALFERADLDKADIVDVLTRLVPSFHHVETGKSLDSKM